MTEKTDGDDRHSPTPVKPILANTSRVYRTKDRVQLCGMRLSALHRFRLPAALFGCLFWGFLLRFHLRSPVVISISTATQTTKRTESSLVYCGSTQCMITVQRFGLKGPVTTLPPTATPVCAAQMSAHCLQRIPWQAQFRTAGALCRN